MQNLIKKDSKEIVLDNLDSYKEKELDSIDKIFGAKIEKINNKLFLLSTYKDEEISNLKNDISELETLELKSDAKMSHEEIQKNILNKQELIKSKEIKWDGLIQKHKISAEKLINKYNQQKEKLFKKVIDKIESMKQAVLSSKDRVDKLDDQEYQKALVKVEEKRKNKNPEAADEYIEKYNSFNTTRYSKLYNWKLKSKNFFSPSFNDTAKRKTWRMIDSIKLIFIILIFAIVVGFVEPGFFTFHNIKTIFDNNADLGCLAIGVTVIILTGGIDLSVGSTMAFTAAIIAKLTLAGWGVGWVLLVGVIFCVISGLIAGLFVSILKFPPFIITLILMMVWRGAAQALLEQSTTGFNSVAMIKLVQSSFLGLSATVWIMFALAIVAFIILKFTIWGRQVYATGNNYKSAQLSGIKVRMILISVYVFAGLCIGIGSFIYAARIQSASPSAGTSWELDAIACVVLGGTLLTGGKGGILQTMLGWFALSVLKNALGVLAWSSDIQSILKGIIIMLAVLSNTEYKITQKIYLIVNRTYNKVKIRYFYKLNKE